MTKSRSASPNKMILVVAIIVGIACGLVYLWFEVPRRTTGAFAADLYSERYQEAAASLVPPSALSVDPDGGLVVTDKTGHTVTVPKAQLPFKIYGDGEDAVDEFAMMATASSTNGIADAPPIIIRLRVEGLKVTIESVEIMGQ